MVNATTIPCGFVNTASIRQIDAPHDARFSSSQLSHSDLDRKWNESRNALDTWENTSLMTWLQRQMTLTPRSRGFHLITQEILQSLPDLATIKVGLLHVFIRHTSASLTINENADSDVRRDLESALNTLAPEDFPYVHTIEGPDDMPAHVKASLMGSSVTIPIADGRLLFGTWQGIYLCEHRNKAAGRSLVLTLWGEKR